MPIWRYQRFVRGVNVWGPRSGNLVVGEWRLPDEQSAQERAEAILQEALQVACSWIGELDVRAEPGRIVHREAARFHLFVPCEQEGLGAHAFSLALEALLQVVLDGGSGPRARALAEQQWRQWARPRAFDQSTRALVRAALEREIPFYPSGAGREWVQLGQGRHALRIRETASDQTSSVGRLLAGDKLATQRLLQQHGLPGTGAVPIADAHQALQLAREWRQAVVVKPRRASKGQGVSVALTDPEAIAAACVRAAQYPGGVVIERFYTGNDYRLLVVGGKLVAAACRVPAGVVGDGRRPVVDLVAELNADPARGAPFERLLERVVLDDEALSCLQKQGLTPNSVPEPGCEVRLRRTANISRGGTALDVTALVHPDVRWAVERATRLVGLDVAGVDLISPDISQSWRTLSCAILEINPSPGLRPHHIADPDVKVERSIIAQWFPPGRSVRVPTIGVTGTLGKTTTTHWVAHMLTQCGWTVGRTTTQGAWLGEQRLWHGEASGGRVASQLLADPLLDAGVFEFARGALLKSGLGFDALSIGIVLNVGDNHIGQDGIGSRADLARIKQLVVQAATDGVVLNADDPWCRAMQSVVAPQVRQVWLSCEAHNPLIEAHREAGGTVAILRGECAPDLCVYRGQDLWLKLPLADVPASLGGRFRAAAWHALATAAVGFQLGLQPALVREAWLSFTNEWHCNPGRNNVIYDLPHTLVASYADGPEPVAAVTALAASLPAAGPRVWVLTAAGDRPDEFIERCAKAAVHPAFDCYLCADWTERRGRAGGEVANLLAAGLCRAGVPRSQIQCVRDPRQAYAKALALVGAQGLILDNTYTDSATDDWWRERGVTS